MLSTILCTLGLTIATASASTSSHSSQIDVNGVVESIKQYSTTGTWSSANYQVVQDTLGASISNPPNIASSPSTSATASCTISNPYNANKISQILSSCNNILVDGLTVPAGTTLKLDAEPNTVITFKGHTTWQYKGANYDLLQLSGENLIVQGSPGHVIDGNGPAWWDGLGSNGAGSKNKPDHFITVSGVSGYTVLKNLYIKNAPSHVFDVTGADELYAFGVVIDLLDGDKILSNGKEAAHNTDGWDIASTTNSLFTNNVVFNQDDCVAVTSGTNVVINNYYCSGGHGLSVGSVGGKSDKTVEQVTFSNSKVVDSQNGCRIKANSGETGKIDSVTYENISIENISIYGIDIQQDYLNGGATGKPTAGVTITNIVMNNIQGSVQANADNYYILVATPSTNASTWKFKNVDVTGGGASCNSSPPGFTCQ